MKVEKTERGFELAEFVDLNNKKCSIQKSSLACVDAIWLGVDDCEPQIMASKTEKGGTGWVPFEIPKDVLLSTRMHLDRPQAKKLVKLLKRFIKTGEIGKR